MQKSKSASTTMTRPPLSDGWDGYSDDVVRGRRESGRFASAYGMHVISGPPGSPYRRLVLDRDWRPVSAVQAANCQEQHIRNILTLRVDVARLQAQSRSNTFLDQTGGLRSGGDSKTPL